MNPAIISSRISAGQVVLYRRVSTKKQVRGEYRSQLESIKSKYPEFSISKSTIADVTEAKSGRADPEVRMASGLGQSLRLLKRHPDAILLVSNADRIARRTDVFTLIQKQGLGHRVFDADTGMHVNDIIKAGIHRQIETKTEELHAVCQEGLKDYQASGGQLGSPVIRKYAKKASLKKQRLTKERSDAILGVIRNNVLNTRGRVPSYQEACTELNRREIRTGQGRFFTQERLIQWRKNHLTEWSKAIDSYAAPRRRIRWLITMTQIDIRNRRNRKLARRKLTRDVDCPANDMHQSSLWSPPSFSLPIWSKERFCRFRCCDQCRGPP
ncbi:MAG: recombinase family protein [Cognatishimia sp.]|nr:recombinase family protein [Cognatishimia sp.]